MLRVRRLRRERVGVRETARVRVGVGVWVRGSRPISVVDAVRERARARGKCGGDLRPRHAETSKGAS